MLTLIMGLPWLGCGFYPVVDEAAQSIVHNILDQQPESELIIPISEQSP